MFYSNNFSFSLAVGEKFRWFYENVDEYKTHYSCSEVCALIERYLHDDDDNDAIDDDEVMMMIQNYRQNYRTLFYVELHLAKSFFTGSLQINR